jgi:DNA primase
MPNLVEIVADHLGTIAKRNGHAFHFGCPNCGEGTDRFIVWSPGPSKPSGTFFCRQCRVAGDGIEYCKRFLCLTYPQACDLLGAEKKGRFYTHSFSIPKKPTFPTVKPPEQMWQEQGQQHVEVFHRNLKTSLPGQSLLAKRRISLETADQFFIGYNPSDAWERRELWGLPREIKENGKERKVWLPKGLVIPRFDIGEVSLVGLKIRREEWKDGDYLPKYAETVGSANCMGIYGDVSKEVAIVMESEFDAVVVQQEASDLCFCVSLGGAGAKRLDTVVHSLLRENSRLILIATDYDEAGLNELEWWVKIFPQAIHWPTPYSKSPGDAYINGLNIRLWVQCAINKYKGDNYEK